MNNIQFGPGVIFCSGSDGKPFMLGEVGNMEIMPTKFETEIHEDVGPLIVSRQDEISFEVKIGKRKMDKFLQFALGITDMVLDIARAEGHRRIVHLAKNSKKKRTREKNVRRAYRIVQKVRG